MEKHGPLACTPDRRLSSLSCKRYSKMRLLAFAALMLPALRVFTGRRGR